MVRKREKDQTTEESRRSARRNGHSPEIDGITRVIHDRNRRAVFRLEEIEESADVRVIRVIVVRHEDWMIPECPSDSERILSNPREINMRVECHEEVTLFDLLYQVVDGKRRLDLLEEKLDRWLWRKSELAYLVDVYFSRLMRVVSTF